MKNILLSMITVFLLVLTLSTVAAADWDNKLTYSNNDLKVTFENSILGIIPTSEIGTAELKSHPSVNYVYLVSSVGKAVPIWYDMDFLDIYPNGLGNVKFIDKNTGQAITRNYSYVYWGNEAWSNKTGNGTVQKWLPYNSKDIPLGKIRIGIEVDVKEGDYIDAVWTIVGKEVTKHAEYRQLLVGVDVDSTLQCNGACQEMGIQVQIKWSNITSYVVQKGSQTTATKCHLWYNNQTTTIGAEGTFSGNNCTINTPTPLTPGLYWFGINNSGSNYILYRSGSFPFVQSFPELSMVSSSHDAWIGSYNVSVKGIQAIWVSDLTLPTVNLISPINNYNTSNATITFIGNATSSIGVANVSLIIDGLYNQTNTSGINTTNYTFTKILSEGNHNWTYEVCNSQTCVNATVRNLRIDLTVPIVNIITPLNNSEILSPTATYNVSFNISVSDNLGLSNCIYYNDSANNSITCGNNATIPLTAGTHTLIYYANDTAGNIGSNSTTFTINVYSPTINYTTPVIELENQTVYFNITASSISSASANLSYNGTNYSMTLISNNGTLALFNRTITTPEVNTDTSVNFSIYFNINGAVGQTANQTQLIYNIPSLIVSTSCNDKAIKFNLQDEANLTALNGTFQYNFAYGTGTNNTFSRVFGNITNANTFYVCINSTISNNWSLGEGQVFYSASGYVDRRYYLFVNTTLSNSTQNITLYDLLSADQTSFKLEVEDTSLNPYENKFTTLVRWYPELNQYNVVDMGLTDETGATVIHVVAEDVDYRIGVYEQNGSLIFLANPIRMVCLVSPCTYTLKISPTDTDYTSFENIDYSFTFNQTTGIWTFTFVDTSQKTTEMNLTVYKLTGTSVYPVCTSSLTAYTGAITCNTSAYTGNLKGIVLRSASPPIPIVEKIVTVGTNAFSSGFGLFVSLLIGLPIIFIFAFMSPIGAVIGAVVALIPALYFGSITWVIMGGIAVLAGIVLHFLKRI